MTRAALGWTLALLAPIAPADDDQDDAPAAAPAAPAAAAPAPRAQPLPPLAPASAVAAAAQALRSDPQLFRSEKRGELRWRHAREDKPRKPEPDGFAQWLNSLLRWLDDSGRALMWLLGAIAAAVLVVRLRLWRWLGRRAAGPDESAPPTHVRELDIRPQSLPDDIGAAALALWRAGQPQAALALLYRGALSRLVHGHGVALAASSTEGECLALARGRLSGATWDWLAGLVRLWQAWVYGSIRPADADIEQVCLRFAVMLPAPAAGSAAVAGIQEQAR